MSSVHISHLLPLTMYSVLRVAVLTGVLLAATCSAADYYSLPSPYGWRCMAGSCVRQERTVTNTASLKAFSTCKLTCGAHGTLWPKPSKLTRIARQTEHFLVANLRLSDIRAPDAAVEQLMRRSWTIFLQNLASLAPAHHPSTNTSYHLTQQISFHEVHVDITVSRPGTDLTFHTSELYTLGVTTQQPSESSIITTTCKTSQDGGDEEEDAVCGVTRVSIISSTFFGARHGLESLSQLIAYDDDAQAYEIVATAAVVDEPVYPYRGLLLDTARNYFSVASIKRTLDGMAASKLNAFHWHISDSQSFPLVLPSLPKMAYYGAYSAEQVYRAEDVREVVEYARVRGIRVIPELDAPAHVGNGWQWGQKEGLGDLLACFNKRPWTRYCVEPPCGQLNLANPAIYTVLAKIYRDFIALFSPLELFHYGGDEINLNCWNSTKAIRDMMRQEGNGLSASAYYQQWAKFQEKATELLSLAKNEVNNGTSNITGIIWSSKLTEMPHVQQYLDKNKYIIQMWSKSSNLGQMKDLLTEGYRIIVSSADAWYLDCGFSSWVSDGHNWCSPYTTWQQVYSHRPSVLARMATGSDSYRSQILGGEVAAWSEQMDSFSLDNKVWPRAAAFAERVWSDPVEGWGAAESRLVHHRQRLVSRGIMANRIKPQWCHQHDAMCTISG
uniref:Beta-hexosaminidase n=1 Tax=Hirondellea gigas TaxID=1518452 RepID=A0A2P2I9A9_9CRUS